MDGLIQSLPDILKAAATSGLGAFALLAVIVGLLAWRLFHNAPPAWRFAAFALLFVGAAAYAAALFIQTPDVLRHADVPAAATSSGVAIQHDPVVPLKKPCRLPANGIERYEQETRIPMDSGWIDGGSNPHDWCSARVVDQQRTYPDRHIHYENPGERSRERLRHFTYRYTCTVVQQWDPIYVLAENADCP